MIAVQDNVNLALHSEQGMSEKPRYCPQCKSKELVQDHLSVKGSAWPVLFGSTLLRKRELLAFACQDCGFVFLALGISEDRPEDKTQRL